MKKLAVITTHPIQYNAPLFRMLNERGKIQIKVFYTWSQTNSGSKYDPGFGKNIEWDIPLLEGYDYSFVENIAADPGSHHNKGIDNPSLIKEIEQWDADAVMVYGWNFKSHLAAMKHFKKKIPVLFRGDSTLLGERNGLKKILRRLYLRYVYTYIDTALYAGHANKAYFLALGLREDRLVFMPHAIDNKRFESTSPVRDAAAILRKQLSVPEEAIVFLFAGKLDSNKRPDLLARVFISLKKENTYLIIAGNGSNEADLKKTFTEKNIRFLPFQNQLDMPALYAAADIFVLPSVNETWGLSVNEAMAAGKALIVSDGCGAAYDLVKNGNGKVFERNNEKALEEAMMYFASGKQKAIEAGKESLKIIGQFSYEKDCPALEKMLNGI